MDILDRTFYGAAVEAAEQALATLVLASRWGIHKGLDVKLAPPDTSAFLRDGLTALEDMTVGPDWALLMWGGQSVAGPVEETQARVAARLELLAEEWDALTEGAIYPLRPAPTAASLTYPFFQAGRALRIRLEAIRSELGI